MDGSNSSLKNVGSLSEMVAAHSSAPDPVEN
jgi:hypothetical protein